MAERRDDEAFLERWSRRKQARPEAEDGGAGAKSREGKSPATADAAAPAKTPEAEAAAREAEIVARLPDIDSLDESSDFTVFLQRGVPAALRRQALRKLWRVNPIFAHLDGLNEYDEDFTAVGLGVEGLKTAYKVGRGYLSDDEPAESSGERPGASHAESSSSAEVGAAEESKNEDPPADAQVPPEAAPAGAEPEQIPAAVDPSTAPEPHRHAEAAAAPKAGDPVHRPGGRAAERRWGRRDT